MNTLNTPSGTDLYPLDKFILHYADQGYKWTDRSQANYMQPENKVERIIKRNIENFTQSDNDIIFYRLNPESVLCAEAIIEDNKIKKFEINIIK